MPSIVMVPIILGRVVPSVIVPLMLKVMVSFPEPDPQSVEPDWLLLLALVMASRKVQAPSFAMVSAKLLTIIFV